MPPNSSTKLRGRREDCCSVELGVVHDKHARTNTSSKCFVSLDVLDRDWRGRICCLSRPAEAVCSQFLLSYPSPPSPLPPPFTTTPFSYLKLRHEYGRRSWRRCLVWFSSGKFTSSTCGGSDACSGVDGASCHRTGSNFSGSSWGGSALTVLRDYSGVSMSSSQQTSQAGRHLLLQHTSLFDGIPFWIGD